MKDIGQRIMDAASDYSSAALKYQSDCNTRLGIKEDAKRRKLRIACKKAFEQFMRFYKGPK